METIGLVLVIAGLAVLGAAVVALRALRRELAETEAAATDLAERMNALPPELSGSFGTGARHLITVELLNLFELAHRESVFTRPLTALTPRLLRDVVHRRLVTKVRESLTASGVAADVRLHRGR
ncbi:hypothetical protein [Actinophytocola oryzae]|uniref:Uncharacterized protein n=1 Tax=Actinophytocola oryzae TaxID=502181 RepID=A0A4R7W196_9PSEU|nr:hypothetical protein [Actinophytocola oryzae]TDV55297.1 hypothetical protein CLV71_103538 [Actinophytocola oryzae]